MGKKAHFDTYFDLQRTGVFYPQFFFLKSPMLSVILKSAGCIWEKKFAFISLSKLSQYWLLGIIGLAQEHAVEKIRCKKDKCEAGIFMITWRLHKHEDDEEAWSM